MKTVTLALFLAALAPALAAQEDERRNPAETTTAAAAPKSKTEALVEASRAAKRKGRKSTTKVITNADVRKSKGKIVETELKPLPAEAVPTAGMVEIHEAVKKASAEERARIEAAVAKVAELEEELAAIEQQYYDENDLDRRDREVATRFLDASRRLEEARKTLASYTAALTPPESE
jgi:hypothetical protein